MNSKSKNLLVLTVLYYYYIAITTVQSATLPPNIERCRKSDAPATLNECLRRTLFDSVQKFVHGNPALGIPSLDPIHIDSLNIESPQTDASSVALTQRYDNLTVHGLKQLHVISVNAHLMGDQCDFELVLKLPALYLEADYLLRGKILLFPIQGNGKCNITLRDMVVTHQIKCERRNDINKRMHLKVVDYRMLMVPAKVDYDFRGLFPDNEKLRDQIKKTVNDNSLVVFNDVKSGWEDSFALIYKSIVNNVFTRVAEDDLFLN